MYAVPASIGGCALLTVLLLAGCAPGSAAPSTAGAGSTAVPEAPTFDALIDVGDDREIAASCWGDGEPTIIYLHGLIMPYDDANWAHAPELRERLLDESTYCEYERANVGRSSAQEGPIPLEDTLADLDAVLDGIGATSPVVLVGGSFGGIVASSYAGTRPDRVAGVVLLDPSLAGSNALEEQHLPPEYRLTPEAWNDSAEKIDVYAADLVALTALDSIPRVPGTVFVTEHIELPPVNTEAFLAAIRAQQQELADRFSPGELVTVDTPHAMIAHVPDDIAAAILGVIEAAGLDTS